MGKTEKPGKKEALQRKEAPALGGIKTVEQTRGSGPILGVWQVSGKLREFPKFGVIFKGLQGKWKKEKSAISKMLMML